MSSDVEAMYQEIILDHYREKHHCGLREPFDAEVHHVNPSCGDELTLRVDLDGRTRIAIQLGFGAAPVVLDAQAKVVAVARKLAADGLIVFGSGGADDDYV